MSKAVYTTVIGTANQEVTNITVPLIQAYATKIGATFILIDTQQNLGWGHDYEKTQIHTLGTTYDWNIYIDAGAVINYAVMDDITLQCPTNAVGHIGAYGASSWFDIPNDPSQFWANDTVLVPETITDPPNDLVQAILNDPQYASAFRNGDKERMYEALTIELPKLTGLVKTTSNVAKPRDLAVNCDIICASQTCHDVWRPVLLNLIAALSLAKRRDWLDQWCISRNIARYNYNVHHIISTERANGGQDDRSWFRLWELSKTLKTPTQIAAEMTTYMNNYGIVAP